MLATDHQQHQPRRMKRKLDELHTQADDGTTTSSTTSITISKHEEVESSSSNSSKATTTAVVAAATPASDFLAAATAAATVGFDDDVDDVWSSSDDYSDGSYDSEDDDIDSVWRNVGMGMTMVPKRVWSNPEISKLLCAKQKVESTMLERMSKSASAIFPSPMMPSKLSSKTSQHQEVAIQRPEDCLIGHLKKQGITLDMITSKTESFLKISDQDLTSYPEVAYAARRGDLDTLKARLKKGLPLQCTNNYGESIVHIVCRRGSKVMLDFLMNDAKVSVRLKDDVGRTPLHDAVWTAEPNFDLVSALLADSPDLLLVRDKRGHSALSYIPRTNWNRWCTFIDNHQELVQAALQSPNIIIDNKKKQEGEEEAEVESKGDIKEKLFGGGREGAQSIVG